MDRRLFLQRLGLTAAAGFALNCADSSDNQYTVESKAGLGISTAGLQLYTVRHIVDGDFENIIRKVAEIGYKEIELAGYHNLTPLQIRSLIDELQVTSPSTHLGADVFQENLDQAIEDGQVLGHQYLICPHPGDLPFDTIDDYKMMAEFFNEVGMKCKAAGMQFAYHNHEFEFKTIDGTVPMDVLMENTDSELVAIELDLCWITDAGADPIAFFEKYPGRTHLCHVKDLTKDKKMRDVGAGDIDFAAIFEKSDVAGLKHYIVEHDNPDDPLLSITNSLAHLTG